MINKWPWQGKISYSASVACALCSREDHEEGRRPAESFRRTGWVLTRKHGWVCPNCKHELKEGEA